MPTRLYVGNLPYTTDDNDLRLFFKSYAIGNIRFITDRDTGKARGFGFCEIDDPKQAAAAIAELDGAEMPGSDGRPRRIVVNEAKQEQRTGGGGRNRDRRDGGGRGPRRSHRDSSGDFER